MSPSDFDLREIYELIEGAGPEPAATLEAATPAQEANGRLALNNKGGPGNPPAPQVAQLRSLALKLTDEAPAKPSANPAMWVRYF